MREIPNLIELSYGNAQDKAGGDVKALIASLSFVGMIGAVMIAYGTVKEWRMGK